jgi:hypothetical protein
MRRVREMLRLKYEAGASDRAIARSVGVARSTARLCLDRVAAAGRTWPLPETLTDGALEALLFAGAGAPPGQRRKTEPDPTFPPASERRRHTSALRPGTRFRHHAGRRRCCANAG